LALEQRGDVLLKFDNLASHGLGGAGTHEASPECTCQNGGAENDDIADTHEQSS
jgi:hypothetical protein